MRIRSVFFFAVIAAISLLSMICAISVQAQDFAESPFVSPATLPLITQPVDETQVTVLKGNTHRLARPQFDLGTAPASLPMQRMLLVLKRSPEQETALRKLLDDQQDKKSPNYHKWLTPEQFGKHFGPSDADMQTITSWLQSHGFEVNAISKGRTVIEFSGSASQVQEAFHATIHKYIVKEEQHWANANDPSIPTALTPAVAGVYTLHNFVKKPMYRLSRQKGIIKPGKPPQIDLQGGGHALSPGDYAVIYNITPVYNVAITGNGISIGVVGRSDFVSSDIQQFQQLFAVNGTTPQIIVNGPDPGDVPGDDVEATLDVTWSGAIAPGATILFVNSAITNTTDGVFLSELYIVDNNLSNIMTASFGGCEADFGAQASGDAAIAEQAASQGISFFSSTGDAGAEGCDDPNTETVAMGPISVDLPAAAPFVTAVGGTMFNENGHDATYWSATNGSGGESALGYIPEDVWNESCQGTSCPSGVSPNIASGGGGVSTFFTKPSWQAVVTGIPADNARDIPDVALTAASHDGYALCFQDSCASSEFFLIGGTSASAPSFAGIMALVDQNMNLKGFSPRQGLANYVLYPLAAAQQAAKTACNASGTPALAATSGCVFNDVTVGNNAVPGEVNFGSPSALYKAGTGYDQATGLGSVNVENLVNAWANATFTSTTTTLTLTPISPVTLNNIPHGSSVTVNITVAETNPPNTAASGDVSLIAATGPNGSTGMEQLTLLSNGTSTSSISVLPGGGPYAVTAHYAGISATNPPSTTFFAPSDSAAVMVNVLPESSTTAISGFDPNNNFITTGNNSFPFGTPLAIRADVAGLSGQGIPTGQVTFSDSFGSLPSQIAGFGPVANPVSLNSQGNATLGGGNINFVGVFNFDAGNHSLSAAYGSDPSFQASSSTSPVAFSIQPGFTGVSGLANVTIASPGLSGTTTLGVVASTGFANISITCSFSPAAPETACNMPPITTKGPANIVTGTITVTTMGPHLVMMQSHQPTYCFAAILGGGLPLAGIFLLAAPKRRFLGVLLGLVLVTLLVGLPACGGGGHHTVQQQQDPGTPAGTYTVTVVATGGGLSQNEGFFTLTVQ